MSTPHDTRLGFDPYAPPWVRDPNYRHADRLRRRPPGTEPAPAVPRGDPDLPRDFPELSRKRRGIHYALAVSAAAGAAYLMSWSTTGRVVDMAVQTKRASGGPAAVVPVDPPLRKPMKTVGMSLQMMKSDVADPPASPHRMVSQTAEPPSVFDTTPAKRSERLSRTSDAQNTATAGLASAPMPSTTKLDEETIAVLIKRAERFIDAGDFSSARADLRRPAEAGNRKAALALARTYDPAEFKRFGVRGLAPDPVQARHWYERARSFGSTKEPKPAGAPALREGELWLIVASSSEFETAVTMARKYKPEFPTAMVLNSENGQYAVILGRFLEDSGRQQLAKLKAENKVRQDSYLSVGNKLRDVAWR